MRWFAIKFRRSFQHNNTTRMAAQAAITKGPSTWEVTGQFTFNSCLKALKATSGSGIKTQMDWTSTPVSTHPTHCCDVLTACRARVQLRAEAALCREILQPGLISGLHAVLEDTHSLSLCLLELH